MVTYKQMHSILLKDGCKYLVDLDDWAVTQLRGTHDDEFDQYSRDYVNEITPYYMDLMDSGYLVSTEITESLPDSDVKIVVGITYTWVGGEERDHPKHLEWLAKFAADPAVTYNPPILVVE